jgi:hypothetical protein
MILMTAMRFRPSKHLFSVTDLTSICWLFFLNFLLTIQNTPFSQARSLILLRQVLIFAAAAARAPSPSRPPFGGREVPKKENRL